VSDGTRDDGYGEPPEDHGMKSAERTVFTILLVEDDGADVEVFLRTIEEDLPRRDDEEVELVIAARAEGALQILDERQIDLVITDLRLPGISGIDLLKHIQAKDRRIPVIVLSWVHTIDTGVEAMRCGAFDYVTKPFQKLDFAARIHRAMRMSEMLFRFEQGHLDALPFKELVGVSSLFRNVTVLVEAAARVPTTTLIVGETGTGKELIAHAIHERSMERHGAFQVIDCTTVSEGTVESEWFGHVRGAFTGAVQGKLGLLEQGIGGTVFLDEIGDLPLALQAKLLRVLEEREMRAVGSLQTKKVNARFIAATNQDLAEKVKRQEFRKDLFFRLNVMAIRIPPLRERTEDIPLLARHFIARYSKEFSKYVTDLHPSAMTELLAYPWPGNVRELRNVIERAVMLAKSDRISLHDMTGLLQYAQGGDRATDDYCGLPYAQAKQKVLQDFSQRYIRQKLDSHHGNISQAAKEAQIPRSYLHRIIRRYVKPAC
jgi:DNA-binding NtrC family response regulator